MARETFSSRMRAVLTMIGVAVGLGNVWRFPYMMGQNGGGAFLLIFLFFVVVFGIPGIMGEWAFGRITRRGPLGSFEQVWGKPGLALGWLLVFVVLGADSYYLLVIAYIVYTAWRCVFFGFDPNDLSVYNEGMANGWLQYGIALGLLVASLIVMGRGLKGGIEKASSLCVPFFGITLLALIVYVLSRDGAMTHLLNFLKPDFTKVTSQTIFAAMGQAIFSLSLGGTFFVIYGSYLKENDRIPGAAFWTGMGDAGAALLAGLFIVPATLSFGLAMNSGPGLIFSTLPQLFGTMPGGRIVGGIFLLALILVAFLSNMAALQVAVGGFTDRLGISLPKALLAVGFIEVVLILPTALNPDLIGVLDLVLGSGMQCLGSMLALLALTWGIGKTKAIQGIFGENQKRGALTIQWLRWGVPLALGLTLLLYIYEQMK